MTARNSRPRVHLFVGPSIPPDELAHACAAIDGEVVIAPPVQQGDLLRLLSDPPDVVGIVDGYFFQVPAVLHKEILLLLERGVRVLGAASLGALRPAELDRLGMEGVGRIYQMYKAGEIDADDEVAVLHAEAADGYRPLTLPLVTVRHTLKLARRRGSISAGAARAALASARRLHFTERTTTAIVHGVRGDALTADDLVALRGALCDEAVDLKRQDALALIHTIAERVQHRWPWHRDSPVLTRWTSTFRQHLRTYVGRSVGNHHVPDTLVLGVFKLLSADLSRCQRRVALRCVAIDEAISRGLQPADDSVLLARFRCQRRLGDTLAFERWLGAHCLSWDELRAYLRDHDREQRLLAAVRTCHPDCPDDAVCYRRILAAAAARTGLPEDLLLDPPRGSGRPGFDDQMIDELKVSDRFAELLDATGEIVRANADWEARDPRYRLERLKRTRVYAWCADLWGVPVAHLDRAMRARGFDDEEFENTARRLYAYVRFGPTDAHRRVSRLRSINDRGAP